MVSFGEKAKIKNGGKFELRLQLCYYNCLKKNDSKHKFGAIFVVYTVKSYTKASSFSLMLMLD